MLARKTPLPGFPMGREIPHCEKQKKILLSDQELTIAATGTQFGKSRFGALWLKRQIHKNKDPEANYIIAAPTYKILQQSALPYFLHFMRGCGEYRKADSMFEVKKSGIVYFRTETDPDSIVGIPRVRAGWLDEAGKLRLYFWENYNARAASVGAKTLLTTSPYSRNWLYKDFIKPIKSGKKKDVLLIQAASWENPYHSLYDETKREKMRASMDPRRFDMLFGGEWGQMAGLVYDCFDEDQNIVEPFQLPVGTKYYGGVDWGYAPDPFVLKVRAITPDNRHYSVSEFVQTRMTISDIVKALKQKSEVFDIKTFYCDPSQPGYIEELNRAGLPAIGADNDIARGVDLQYELIKSRRWKLFKGLNPHTEDELSTYHWPEDVELKPDQSSKEIKPVGQDDHCLDCERYLTISLYRSGQKLVPRVPGEVKTQETIEDRLKRLKKGRSKYKNTETWD
jgi:hypothetical protein